MVYAEVFGGGSINPSRRTYLSLVTAVSVALQWPIEQQIAGNVAADIIDLDATVPGINVDFSDARQISNGFTSLITNVGAQTATIRDSSGGTIISLAAGESWFIYLTSNATAAGTWRSFQLGATVSVSNASALAGAGIKAIATSLNQTMPPSLTAVTPITWVNANRALFTVWTGGVGVLNLPTPGTVGSDWFSIVRNEGSGNLTLTPPAGTIDSAATLIMAPGTSAIVVTDGTNFYTVGLGTSTVGTFDFVQINVAGTGDFTLSGVQLNRISYQFIGVLTGNRSIIVPNTVQQYWVDNSTTGAFTLDVATVAQVTPRQVIQNNRSILYCDGTDVVDADTGTLTPPIIIGQGGTGAVTAPLALANLGAVALVYVLTSGTGLTGGGDLSAPRTLNVVANADASIIANANDIQVGILATDVQHGVRGGGTQHAAATLTVQGFVELATIAEVSAGADAVRAVTPNSLADPANTNFGIESGNFVPTHTGFSAPPVGDVFWMRQGNIVFVRFDFVFGISDASSWTITNVPAAIQPNETQIVYLGIAVDSGGAVDGTHIIITASSATWTFHPGHALFTGWTPTGNKGFPMSGDNQPFSYSLAWATP